jgi:DNA-directed RNA polymerase subunit H (RpoH/RPB5)
MLSRMLKKDLEEIARIEKISKAGNKDELVKRISKKLRLKKTRKYFAALSMRNKPDILKHTLVPPHRIIGKEEISGVKKKYGIKKKSQLPKIFVRDPVMISLGAEKGDVIEITRKNSFSGESKYYRLVI